MLTMTGVGLEKMSDIDMYLFIENGLRGGISYMAKRYSKANNKYMKNYDPSKQSEFISYQDMNNLYGWEMSEYFPCEGFKWLKNVDNFDANLISEKSLIGYILQVRISWRIIQIAQWLSISSRKTCTSLWHVVRLF